MPEQFKASVNFDGVEPHSKRVIAGLDPRLSGLIFVDVAHGGFFCVLTFCRRSRHGKEPRPCATPIQYFTRF